MSALVVDGPALEAMATAVRRSSARLAQATAGLPVAHAVVAAQVPDGAAVTELAGAVRERARLLARLDALAATVAAACTTWSSAERTVAGSWVGAWGVAAPVAGRWGGEGPSALGDGAVAGAGPEDLLATLPPDLLERLLVAAPALALSVVDGPPASSATPAGAAPGTAPGALVAGDAARLDRAVAAASLQADEPGARSVAALLATVPAGRRRRLALLRPRLVSAVAAAPPEDRAAACRVLVSADLARLERRLAVVPPGRFRQQLLRDVAERRDLLYGSVLLRRPDGSASRRPHQLLTFDPSGDGEIVEVLGDLRRAEHLAVLLPGTGGDLHRYPGYLSRARTFAAADPDLAVVLWQGADFPDQPFDDGVLPLRVHVIAAAYRDAADLAGPALAAEVAGLKVAAPRPARDLTVLGHSYGGSIVGSAEAHGMVVDRVVHIGSAGAYVHDVSEYAAPPGRTRRFSLTTYDDPIRLSQGYDLDDTASRVRAMTPPVLDVADPLLGAVAARAARALAGDPSQVGHGADPDLLPGVVRLDPGRHDDGRPVSGHSDMFTPDSTAWRNLLATMDGGRVQVLEPQRWASHLVPLTAHDWPHYVVDRTPWSDPRYRPPVLDLRPRWTP